MEVTIPTNLPELEYYGNEEIYKKRIVFKEVKHMAEVDPMFALPKEIIDFTKQLHEENEMIHKNPMSSTADISFQVIKFTKKEL